MKSVTTIIAYARLRAKTLYKLDNYADKIGMYTSYRIHDNETVGSTNRTVEEIIDELRKIGYEYNSISAAKQHSKSGRIETGSFRHVPEEHPKLDEPQIINNWKPTECQYHVHLFSINGTVELTSHYEVRPDILSPNLSKSRLRTHYRPKWNETYLPGIHEESVRGIVEE